jgi:hypothetical protein
MRAHEVPPVCVSVSHTRGAYRKRRLGRGTARWDLDRRMCAEPTRRIATLTLTVADADPMAARGRIRDFWAKVRKRWLGTRYFCWLELQRRGAVHYHAVWLNPPHVKRVNLLAWVARAWGVGRTRVRFSDGRGGMERELAYVYGYTKKMGRKAYQQLYDDVPRELRTFMSQRLDVAPDDLDPHLDRWDAEYVGESTYLGRHAPEHLVLRARLVHEVVPVLNERPGLNKTFCNVQLLRRSSRPPPRSAPQGSVDGGRSARLLELQHFSRRVAGAL